ncbi:MAG: epoxyqueuosine reductase [Desulfobacteraceae bacterium]|nr:epoxyqueuosine reductase [Desulfobacteraceae bacterium]MBC2757679.1 epoxyqueuosine reductase [Desulfobacteraceae bacterium]
MDDPEKYALEYLTTFGATHVGIATIESLSGGPPSTDITYLMPEAKSAIVFAYPFDNSLIPGFLKKEDRFGFEQENFKANYLATGLSMWAAHEIKQRGHNAIPVLTNNSYRDDTPMGKYDMQPDLNLKFLAVRSGIGHFGLSGNVLTKEYGPNVVLGAIVTSAPMELTDPLPSEDNYCDNCRLCTASCAAHFVDPEEKTTITMGGVSFEHPKLRSYNRCTYVCGGFSGLHESGKWSTWSPGRFPIPKDDQGFADAIGKHLGAYAKRPDMQGGYYNYLMPFSKIYQTCGNCQFVCDPDKEVRKERYKMLTQSGVVVQHADGRLEAMSKEDAAAFVAALPPERKKLYEEIE